MKCSFWSKKSRLLCRCCHKFVQIYWQISFGTSWEKLCAAFKTPERMNMNWIKCKYDRVTKEKEKKKVNTNVALYFIAEGHLAYVPSYACAVYALIWVDSWNDDFLLYDVAHTMSYHIPFIFSCEFLFHSILFYFRYTQK